MVRAEVNGHSTLLIVDSGATYHALEGSFASEVGTIVDAGADARSHVGEATRIGKIESVTIMVDGRLAVRNATIPTVPPSTSLQAMGIGGVLSPQSLAPVGFATVLDLQGQRVAVLTGSIGVSDRPGPGDSLAPNGIQVCHSNERRYLVPAKVDGQSAILELDTGSPETHLFAKSKIGTVLSQRARRTERRGSVGGEFEVRVVPGVDVQAGDVHRHVDALLIPGAAPENCQFDGMLGMDVLNNCRLALDQNGGVGRCPSPPPAL